MTKKYFDYVNSKKMEEYFKSQNYICLLNISKKEPFLIKIDHSQNIEQLAEEIKKDIIIQMLLSMDDACIKYFNDC